MEIIEEALLSISDDDIVSWRHDPITKVIALQCENEIKSIDHKILSIVSDFSVPFEERSNRAAALTGAKATYAELLSICVGDKGI